MLERFLPLWTRLIDEKNLTNINGVWLIHSDEPLIHQWLIDALKPHYQAHHQQIKRMELISAKSWSDVLSELNSLDLFAENSALIVTGKHKPDIKMLEKFQQFIQDSQNGQNSNHLLWCLPKQDKKSLSTKVMKFFEQSGLVIDGNIHNEEMRATLLAKKAKQFQLNFETDAWQFLISHTQQNLLAAYQILSQLSLSWTNQTIHLSILNQILQDSSQFDVFELSDAMLLGSLKKSMQILYYLQNSDIVPSIVLWTLSKDVQLILQLQAGKNPHELGIWKNKIASYQTAAHRTQAISQNWIHQLYQIDSAIKGITKQNPWQLIKLLITSFCHPPTPSFIKR